MAAEKPLWQNSANREGVGLLVVGVDVGASGCRVAVARDGALQAIDFAGGAPQLPSLVMVLPHEVVVGHAALARAVTDPACAVRDPLRAVAASGRASPAWHAAQALLAEALAHVERVMGERASALLCVEPRRANTAPSPHLLALLRETGIERVASVPKALAAAACARPESQHARVLTVDVGASHVHVACTDLRRGLEGEVIAERSLPHGGAEVDAALVRLVTQRLGGFTAEVSAREMLRQLCVALKPQLAEAHAATCDVPAFLAPKAANPRVVITRDDFEDALAPVLAAVQRACAEVKAEAAGARSHDDALHLLGGLCHVPALRALVEAAFGARARVHGALGAQALGAARLAAARSSSPRPGGASMPPQRPQITTLQRPPSPMSMRPPVSTPPRDSTPPTARAAAHNSTPPPAHAAPRNSTPPPAHAGPRNSTPPPAHAASRSSAPPPAHAGPRNSTPPPAHAGPRNSAPPPAQATTRISSPPPAHIASRSSAPPRATNPPRASLPPPPDSGTTYNPTQASELLVTSLADTTAAAITLPALLMSLAMHGRSATLVLTPDAARPLSFHFAEGRVQLTDHEALALVELHHVPRMRYRIEPSAPLAPGSRRSRSVLAIVFDGLRRLLRGSSDDEMQRALASHMDQAPHLNEELAERLITRLALSSLEARVLCFSFDAGLSARDVVASDPLRRRTILTLLVGLHALELIEWVVPKPKAARSLADELRARAAALASANHFEVLRVHWSATGEEIEHAHAELHASLALGTPAYAAAPIACARLVERADAALADLSHPESRARYRKRTFPNLSFESIEDFLDKKAHAVAMRDDGAREAQNILDHKREVTRTKKEH